MDSSPDFTQGLVVGILITLKIFQECRLGGRNECGWAWSSCSSLYGRAAQLKDFLPSWMLFELSQMHHCGATPYYFNIQAPSSHNRSLSGGASITVALTRVGAVLRS